MDKLKIGSTEPILQSYRPNTTGQILIISQTSSLFSCLLS